MKKKDSKKKNFPKIVVNGDVVIDWLEISTPAATSTPENQNILNWQTLTGTRQIPKLGGALLLAEFLKVRTNGNVLSPSPKKIENIPPEQTIHSIIRLDKFSYNIGQKKDQVFRVSQFKGYAGPQDRSPIPLEMAEDDPQAKILVLDDAGNGFRDAAEKFWPAALTAGKPDWIILKMSHPLVQGKLWNKLSQDYPDKLILIFTADDLRRLGAKISRKASWERTATDFVWQMAANPKLLPLNNCACLVARFGVDGAIVYRRRAGEVNAQLLYDPLIAEDGFSEYCPGNMTGIGSAFVSSIVAHVAEKGFQKIIDGIRQGLLVSRRLWKLGFGMNWQKLQYPFAEVFQKPAEPENPIMDVPIPAPLKIESSDPGYWCILQDITDLGLEKAAFNQVIFGKDSSLDRVPLGRFRNLMTFDRSEIEILCNIKNLIREYLENPNITRPLCISVFGPPGSGKSFAVTEVAKSVAPEKLAKDPLEFNLSQFNSTSELIAAFHRVRDVTLEGKIPIVFFDEFDTAFNGKLGWLKYFLAPMQDGKFREVETMHPLGRSIFVFAGGTSSTFAHFSREEKKDIQDQDRQFFVDAKGPDFVSRLRGYINIKGPDPVDDHEKHYLIRRALIIRFLLKKKAGHIFNSRGECRIDPGVLRALLKVPKYKHGIRSIEATIEMSMLSGRPGFEQAALPAAEQLKLHVDADEFTQLVTRDVLLGGAREE
ncbi:MAG: AAA family ATPase, partial [Candidatus Aminicenantes bacterium]|nr:AAA family ATPase [Candidatus Aminicenantes bacterium]